MPRRKSDFNHFFALLHPEKVISITFFPLAVFVCDSLAESLGKKGIAKRCSQKVVEESDRKVISRPSLKLET